MAKTISLKAQPRAGIGRTSVKQIRTSGRVPGVVYAKGKSEAISLDNQELYGALHHAAGQNLLVNLEIEGGKGKQLALLQEVQFHPLKDIVLHIDLHGLDPDEKLHTEVPVHEIGEPIGLKAGGVLEVMLRTLTVECLPKDLPDAITVDVSGLELGKILHVGDITLPPGVTVRNPKELPICMVVEPKVVEEPAPGTVAEVKQPEVIKEKKTDEAAAPADGKGGDKGKK